MEEKKNPPATEQPGKGKNSAKAPASTSEEQQKKQRKNKLISYLMYTVGAVIIVIMLMKFFGKPSERTVGGANTELPDPSSDRQRLDSKQNTYDLDPSGGSSYDGGRNLEDIFATAMNKSNPASDESVEVTDSDPYAIFDESLAETQKSIDDFSKSLNQQRQNLLEEEQNGPSEREKELEAELEATKMRLNAKEKADAAVASFMEESARINQELTDKKEDEHRQRIEDNEKEMHRNSVSALTNSGDEGIVSSLSGHRCAAFYGMGGAAVNKNTIAASVYGKQVITSGQQVRLRLEEPMIVGTQVLLPGSILTGTGTVGVDRLYISITSIEYNQVLTTVSLEAYDLDGQRGIFVPGSMEQEALREFGREMASSLASSSEQSVSTLINAQKAADQLKTDLARGAIQGVGRFVERKLDQLRITIQADHKLLLFPNN